MRQAAQIPSSSIVLNDDFIQAQRIKVIIGTYVLIFILDNIPFSWSGYLEGEKANLKYFQLNEAYEEVDEQKRDVASWKKKTQKANSEDIGMITLINFNRSSCIFSAPCTK